MPDHPTLPPRDPNTIDHSPDGPATVPPRDPNATLPPAGPERPSDTGLQPPADPSAAVAATANVPGYELIGELGRGGMGVVYRARQVKLNRPVALKMVLAGGHAAPEDLARFLAEAEAVAALQHSGVVQVFDYGTRDGLPYFALELCPGGSLAAKLAGKPLPPREAAELVEKIARAVQHAHEKGIVHRDLKPGNILLADDGTPKVTDFGLAKRVEGGAGLTQTGAILGTPSYMAPEQAGGPGKSIGPPADVYALGAILYECLTGRPPFLAATALDTVLQVVSEEPVPLRQQNPQAPADLETAAHKCLQKEPGKRYASAAALADDLGRWLRGEPIAARPVGAGERLVRWAKRNRALAAALTAAAVFLVGGTVASTLFGLQAAREATRAADMAQTATEAAEKAETGERKATDAAAKLAAEKERLDRTLSRTNYLLGRTRWEEGRPAEASELLDAVRFDERGFEWGYVRRQNSGSYATLHGHAGAVGSASFSTDGRRIVTAGADGMARVWDARTGIELFALRGGLSASFSPDSRRIVTAELEAAKVWDAGTGIELLTLPVDADVLLSASFSPDSGRIVTTTLMGTTKVRDAHTGTQLLALREDAGNAVSASFSPDGSRIVAMSVDGRARVLDVRTGAILLAMPMRRVEKQPTASFSPDGGRIVMTGSDGTVVVLNARTGAELLTLRGHIGNVLSASFSLDGRRIVTANADGTARVWDGRSGTELLTLRGHVGEVRAASFSPDGGRIVTASADGTAKLWDIRRGSEFLVFGQVQSASFSPSGDRLFTANPHGTRMVMEAHVGSGPPPDMPFQRTAKVWDVHPGTELVDTNYERVAKVWDARTWGELIAQTSVKSAAFSPDGRRFVTVTTDGIAKVWDAQSGAELTALRGRPHEVQSASVSVDGTQIVTATFDGTAMVWDAHRGVGLFGIGRARDVMKSASFSPDARQIVTLNRDATARVWDVRTGLEIAAFPRVRSASFSPDGQRILMTGRDATSTATVWDVGRKAKLLALRGVTSASFSPDGQRIVAVSSGTAAPDKTARVWDVTSGIELFALRGHTLEVRSAVYSHDGRRIVTASNDRSVKVWDARTGAELLTLHHAKAVHAASFDPDGRRIVTVSEGGTAKVWDARTSAVPATLIGHTAPVKAVAFSPDGRQLASRDTSGQVKVWDVATGHEVSELASFDFDRDGARRHGQILAVPQGNDILLVNLRPPDEWELDQRQFHARVNPWWHQEQSDAAAKSNDAAAVAFHRGWVATAWPDDADAWKQLDAACRQAGSPKHMLAACDRVLDANPNNADARRRRALYRGSAAAAVGAFAAGWPGLVPLADW